MRQAEDLNGLTPVTPHLVCAGADDAIAFYQKAFDAEVLSRIAAPDGLVMNAQLKINGGAIMIVDEMKPHNASPKTLGGSPVSVHLAVADVDGVFAQAVAAGAKVTMPVEDMFWGDRFGMIEDPFGHHWSIATPKTALSQDEVIAAIPKNPGCG